MKEKSLLLPMSILVLGLAVFSRGLPAVTAEPGTLYPEGSVD
jgi:hypothetical protein